MADATVLDSCAPLTRPTLSDQEAAELERVFKALADRHRVKIVNILAHAGEHGVCACDFVPSLGLGQPTVSYHLKQLLTAGLVHRERRGSYVHYRLVSGALERVGALVVDIPLVEVA